MLRRFLGASLLARALRSSFFSSTGFIGENLLRLAGNLVLTRLLFPEAFGLMALVGVVIAGLQMFSDLGLNASVIQNDRGEEPAFLNTVWTMQIARGVILFLAAWVLAAPIAEFYGEPLLAQMIPVAALATLAQGFTSTRMAVLNRGLMLGRVTALMLATQAVGLLVIVVLAFLMQSVWALVLGGLVAPVLLAALSHIAVPGHRNRLAFEPQAARSILSFGGYLFLSTLATFLITQGDRALLGKLVTLSDLALYNIAFFFASVPLLLINRLSDAVLFPVYRETLRSDGTPQNAARLRLLLAGGATGLSMILALIGDHLIAFLYDPRYVEAGLILVVIAVSQVAIMIETTYATMPLAAGHSRRFMTIVVTSALLRLLMLAVLAWQFGLLGVAVAPALSALLFLPINLALTARYHRWVIGPDMGLFAASLALAATLIWLKWETLSAAAARFTG